MADEQEPTLASQATFEKPLHTPLLAEQLHLSQSEESLSVTDEKKPDPQGVRWFRENSVPIASVILILLVFCLVSQSGRFNLTRSPTGSHLVNPVRPPVQKCQEELQVTDPSS